VTAKIIFEHPLNERIRTFLRLEHLFEKVDYFMPQYDPWTTRVAVDALMDITAVTARADMKSEIQKELDRNMASLRRLARDPAVDSAALERILGELEHAARGI
jgi:cell division protein ZapD